MNTTIPVIVLCFNPSVLNATVEALASAGQAEIHVVAGNQFKWRYGNKLIASTTSLPPGPRNNEEVLKIILALAEKIRSEALLPVWIEDAAFIVKNYEALAVAKPVLIPGKNLFEQLVNKLCFTRLTESLGFLTPKTIEVSPSLDVSETVNILGLPILAKPEVGSGGNGMLEIFDETSLRSFLNDQTSCRKMILQEKVQGEDVALTLLADKGNVFAVMMRKRWFTPRRSRPFSAIINVEFFRDSWLEEMGREFVRLTRFSGIADFDLKVDFESRRAWFLESDPRMMAGLSTALLFGFNVPWLLVEQSLGRLNCDICVRPANGYFLSAASVPKWILSASWKHPRNGPVQTNWKRLIKDPTTTMKKFSEILKDLYR